MKYLFLTTLLLLSNSVYSITISGPQKVVAGLQHFNVSVDPHNCSLDKTNPTKIKKQNFYCTITWYTDQKHILSENDSVLSSLPLDEGKFIYKAEVKGFLEDKLVHTETLVAAVEVVPFQIEIILEGFPFKVANTKQRVHLVPTENSLFNCIFYEGEPVETPHELISDHKLYCSVSWNNVPGGFERPFKNNPSILEGLLSNKYSDDSDDFTFSYAVKAVLPGGKEVVITDSSVDGTVDTLEIIEMGLNHPNAIKSYTYSKLNKKIILELQIANSNDRAVRAQVIHSETGQVVLDKIVFPEKDYLGFIVPEKLKQAIGLADSYEVKVSYVDIPSINKTETIYVTSTYDTKDFIDVDVYFEDENYKISANLNGPKPAEMFHFYLVELEELSQSPFKSYVFSSLSAEEKVDLAEVKNKSYISTLPHSAYSISRYAVVAEQLIKSADGKELISIKRYFSKPINVIKPSTYSSGNPQLIYTPEGSKTIVTLNNAIKDDEELSWTINREVADNYLLAEKHSNSYLIKNIHMDAEVKITSLEDNKDLFKPINLVIYDTPTLGVLLPENVYPNSQEDFAKIDYPVDKAAFDKHSVSWSIDNEFLFEASHHALNFSKLGSHLIRILIKDATVNDYSMYNTKEMYKLVEVSYNAKR